MNNKTDETYKPSTDHGEERTVLATYILHACTRRLSTVDQTRIGKLPQYPKIIPPRMTKASTTAATPPDASSPTTTMHTSTSNYYPVCLYLAAAALATTFHWSWWTCPHSKVEESFPLQAVHDLFYHGLGPAIQAVLERYFNPLAGNTNILTTTAASLADVLPYDHTQFPGVVPRTFAGPGLLAVGSQVINWILYGVTGGRLNLQEQHPAGVQSLARWLLLVANLHGWWCFATAVDQRQRQNQQRQNQQRQRQPGSRMIGTYLLLVTACQFHLVFYASRMLPNTFAVWLTLYAYAFWIRGSDDNNNNNKGVAQAAATLTAVCAIFRCDMILLLFAVGLSWLMMRQLTIPQAIKIGLVTGLVSLLVTVPLDSLLWQTWVWPEGQVFYFNALQGKSEEWGVLPWYWYWTSALPKVLLGTAVAIPLAGLKLMEHVVVWEERYRNPGQQRAVVTNKSNSNWMVRKIHEWVDFTWMPILLPAFGFCALYSCLGHKETRFLFPVLPLFNLAAAVGLSKVHAAAFGTTTTADSSARHKKDDDHDSSSSLPFVTSKPSLLGRLMYAGCMGLLILTLVASSLFVAVSRWNYPGGQALTRLVQHIQDSNQKGDSHATSNAQTVRVHIDVASAMTGVSLFGQREATVRVPEMEWIFDKAGYEPENQEGSSVDQATTSASDWTSMYTHLLTEDKNVADPDLFRVVDVVQGNPRLDLRRARIATTDAIYILERRDFLES
jgi:alpha-1,6-mannosyltransferase